MVNNTFLPLAHFFPIYEIDPKNKEITTGNMILYHSSGIEEILNYSRLSIFYPPGFLLKMSWVTAWYKIRYSYHISYYKCISMVW